MHTEYINNYISRHSTLTKECFLTYMCNLSKTGIAQKKIDFLELRHSGKINVTFVLRANVAELDVVDKVGQIKALCCHRNMYLGAVRFAAPSV